MTTRGMDPEDDSLTSLVWDVLDNGIVNHAALVRRADEFLAAAQGGSPDLLDAARSMAAAAFELGVFNSPDAHDHLVANARAFSMMLGLHKHHQH